MTKHYLGIYRLFLPLWWIRYISIWSIFFQISPTNGFEVFSPKNLNARIVFSVLFRDWIMFERKKKSFSYWLNESSCVLVHVSRKKTKEYPVWVGAYGNMCWRQTKCMGFASYANCFSTTFLLQILFFICIYFLFSWEIFPFCLCQTVNSICISCCVVLQTQENSSNVV